MPIISIESPKPIGAGINWSLFYKLDVSWLNSEWQEWLEVVHHFVDCNRTTDRIACGRIAKIGRPHGEHARTDYRLISRAKFRGAFQFDALGYAEFIVLKIDELAPVRSHDITIPQEQDGDCRILDFRTIKKVTWRVDQSACFSV